MSTKTELLYKQIFYNFITGVYGVPKIPSEKDIRKIVETINTDKKDPLTKRTILEDIDIDEIIETFRTIIDDIDILYSSVESQSTEVLTQLTNSLKEHNGVKRELKNIDNRVNDIKAGKLGKEYLQYVFTETFNSLENINVTATTQDPDILSPVIDIKAGNMYIPNILSNLVDLTHYYERKLDIINTDYVGNIIEAGYESSSSAKTILDITDDRRLVYKIKTDIPSEMKSSFILQLDPNRKMVKTNGISLQLDHELNTQLRVQYKKDSGWVDIPDIPTTILNKDKILLRFNTLNTTHLKFEFIKQQPDDLESNEYFIIIYNLSVFNAITHKVSTLTSKSIKIESYNNELPIIGNMAVDAKGYIPDGCSADVYVAKDKHIYGYFTNSNGDYVLPDSVHVDTFVEDLTSTYKERHILLSDIKNNPNASNIENYNNIVYDWKLVNSFTEDTYKPKVINFIKAKQVPQFDNTLYNRTSFLLGDYTYDGGYPQENHPDEPTGWFLSGVISESNPNWDTMSGLIESGMIASSGTYTEPTGYPVNYYYNNRDRGNSTIRIGDNSASIDGWWRPDSDLITPSGYDRESYGKIEDSDPDYWFNGLPFYKIFKFAYDSKIVDSTIKLYTYQEKPVSGTDNDYYPHNMTWRYNTKVRLNTFEYDTSQSNPFIDNSVAPGPPESGNFILPVASGDVFIANSIKDVHYIGQTTILQPGVHYTSFMDRSNIWYINMSLAETTEAYSPNDNIAVKYAFRTEDLYTSYWEGFIIASLDNNITIKQHQFNDIDIVDKVVIEDLDGNAIVNEKVIDENHQINIPKGEYKIRIFCLADPVTKYSAGQWAPYDSTFLKTDKGIKIVARMDPITISDFDTLLHTTPYNNDNRAAIITEFDNKYIVVKEPSKNIVPGYYFSAKKNTYIKNTDHLIQNVGHYKRKSVQRVDASGYFVEEYITGSKNDIILNTSDQHDVLTDYDIDLKWNNGQTFPPSFNNTISNKTYTQHSTYGNPITVDVSEYRNQDPEFENKGHLFYNTGENIPAFYNIKYGQVDENDPTTDRFLYKIQLISEHKTNTPVIESLKFVINVHEEDYEN